jgi:hypothetical protein
MSRTAPQGEPRLRHNKEDTMMYNSLEFADAEMRYRQERLARDWQARRVGSTPTGSGHRARTVGATFAGWRLTSRRHRHA